MVKKWVIRILLVVVGLVVGLFGVAAMVPVPTDPVVPLEQSGAGASSVEPSFSGLQRAFPPINEPADNPSTPAKTELGRLLFFDPVLSGNHDIACATCHHPDLGFADGLTTAVGAGGEGIGPERSGGRRLDRNTAGLWNVAYRQNLFWDGRVSSLEEQVLVPLTHVDEMGVTDVDRLVAELAAIQAYDELFAAAFDDGVTLANVQRALAAFQRTLISEASPFDRYAAGDFDALTPSQRRGLALFRSGATRCFECHAAPTFATETFRVIGLPGDDPGRAGVADDGPTGAFRVPALRNVALTAPYMHDGSLATLEAVIDFYAAGGGRANGAVGVDPFVAGFELSDQDRDDLIAFLLALTDESRLPDVPESVPSGLPVVPRLANPARTAVDLANVPANPAERPGRPLNRSLTVAAGQTIQSVVDRAQPGDTIHIPYGIYHEQIIVDLSDITLVGIPNEAGEWPILDGESRLADGVIAAGNNLKIGRLHFRNYTDNGVLVEGATGVHFHDLRAENTGTYGVYPVQSTDILIERVVVSGVDDAGIYAGQCLNVIVRDSVAFGNVIGIELENTINGEVYNNHTYDNTVGIFVVILPNLTSKVARQTKVYDNLVENNNLANFAPEGATARLLPPGVGVLVLGADETEVYRNVMRGNKSTGLALFSLTSTGAFDDIDVGPNPENNYIHHNEYDNNGFDPDAFVADLGVPTGDILWDGSGWGNRFEEVNATGNFPPLLPAPGWPAAFQRAYLNALRFVIGLVG